MAKSKKGMVFGVFDSLHEGHKYFLREATARCDKLIVVVAPDAVVQKLKNRPPRDTISVRMKGVESVDQTLTVISGDDEEGAWSVLEEHRPDRIFLGYDQRALAAALRARGIPLTFISSHKPDVHKSSILKNRSQESPL